MFRCDICKKRVEFVGSTIIENKVVNTCLACMKEKKENATKEEE